MSDLTVGRVTFSLAGHRYEMSGPDLKVEFPDGAVVYRTGAEWRAWRAKEAASERAACAELVRTMARAEREAGSAWEQEAQEMAPGADALHLRACAARANAHHGFADRLEALVADIEERKEG